MSRTWKDKEKRPNYAKRRKVHKAHNSNSKQLADSWDGIVDYGYMRRRLRQRDIDKHSEE